jgi:uncharacterized membrane protein
MQRLSITHTNREKEMELWHWHPIFVHFSVSLLFTASMLFIVQAMARGKIWGQNCQIVARWIFWLGIIAALFTAVTGLLAYFTLPNIDALKRGAINDHFGFAVATAVAYLTLAFFLWQRQRREFPPSKAWIGGLVLAVTLLSITGYLGGNLVFARGIGVTVSSVTLL